MSKHRMDAVVQMDPRVLKNHTLNIELYGEDLPENLLASIEKHDIREPLLVCRSTNPEMDNVIVSGRRRRIAAIKLGKKLVPCQEWKCEDEDELKEELIIRNVRAELTVEQRARMAAKLLEIEQRRAAARAASGTKTDPDEKGRAIDKAAGQVGMKRATATKAIQTVVVADELKAEGMSEQAAEIINTLNSGSVAKAHRQAEETVAAVKQPPKPAPPKENPETKELDAAIGLLVKHEALFRDAIKRVFLAVDAKNMASVPFSSRFKKFESMLRQVSEHADFPKECVTRIAAEWGKAKEQIGSE